MSLQAQVSTSPQTDSSQNLVAEFDPTPSKIPEASPVKVEKVLIPLSVYIACGSPGVHIKDRTWSVHQIELGLTPFDGLKAERLTSVNASLPKWLLIGGADTCFADKEGNTFKAVLLSRNPHHGTDGWNWDKNYGNDTEALRALASKPSAPTS